MRSDSAPLRVIARDQPSLRVKSALKPQHITHLWRPLCHINCCGLWLVSIMQAVVRPGAFRQYRGNAQEPV